MEMGNKSASQWLVFTLANQKYAIHVDYVRELTPARIHQIRGLPQTKDCDVGALSLRGNIIAIRDLRTMIGLPSLEKETAEIIKLLETREQDHVNWIDELTRSVNEGRRFTLARDPHLCAFGKWYDGIMADEQQLNRLTNANLTLHLLIGQLETPHTAIHAIADAVSDLVQEGDTSGAHDLIESVRHHTLNTMVSLLRQIRDLLHTLRKPLIVVVECSGNQLGIQVDSVDCVVRISSDQIQPIPDRLAQSGVFSGVSEIKDEGGLLVMIDGHRLFTGSLESRCMASKPLVGLTG